MMMPAPFRRPWRGQATGVAARMTAQGSSARREPQRRGWRHQILSRSPAVQEAKIARTPATIRVTPYHKALSASAPETKSLRAATANVPKAANPTPMSAPQNLDAR